MSDSIAPARQAEGISDHYDVQGLIGEGGMARVYRARDRVRHADIALKVLTVDPAHGRTAPAVLFEREFQTLTLLRHPNVISVYDYGLTSDGRPFYTMELLAGGDLRERAPMPWREASRVMFEVCSALALLHSRRLLHRDVSPRNIHCTPAGSAKLIDFGALVAMGAGGADVVGTPAFTAPESLHRLALDARTDLFSLGATLYFALTGRLAYPAQTFADVMAAWSCKPPPPSALVREIPAALDDLVLALIDPEPALRPTTAWDVMQQLAACAELPVDETEAVSRAYLATPSLVGRTQVLSHVRARLSRPVRARAAGLLFTGEPGVGRSRILDASALEAKTLGFTVLRAAASGVRTPFGVAHALAKHLLEALPGSATLASSELFEGVGGQPDPAMPSLKPFAGSDVDPGALQAALSRWWLDVAHTRRLLIAVDDAQRMDAPSAALLAALLDERRPTNLCIALTADSGEADTDVLRILARRCDRLPLEPLDPEQTRALLGSLFGEVAHLAMLSDEVYRIARGNARQCMELAQWFLNRGLIQYTAGTWNLPSRLSADDLPSSAADALAARVAALSGHARFLAEAHALAYYDELGMDDYRALLPALSSGETEQAISELLWASALVSDGTNYTLANRVWSAAFLAPLSAAQRQARHRALSTMYEPRSTMAAIHHAFAGSLHEHGLALMVRQHAYLQSDYDHRGMLELNIGKMMWCAAPAVETAQRLRHSAREVHDLRRWHFAGNITFEGGTYDASAQCWFEQLVHDSGLDLYRADSATTDPSQRLMSALTRAQQRYQATPPQERVYAVDEAIRLLGEYVVFAIALGVRTQDCALLRSLPSILEPFVALSPVLELLWNNARATERSQCACQYEQARELWLSVLTKLDAMTIAEFKHAPALRNAVAFALGMMDAYLGLPGAARWAERLDDDPYQRISALQLRKIVRLEQGDVRGAEALQRQAEVLSLQMRSPQMFHSMLVLELIACVRSRDLGGIRHVIEAMRPLAARHAGWQSSLLVAEGEFHLTRGDLAAAREKFGACIEQCALDSQGESSNMAMWIGANQGLANVLLEERQTEAARACASAALAVCEAQDIGVLSFDLVITLALAEARLGQPRGTARIESLIEEMQRRGVSGLRLGLAFEARTQIAIWTDDRSGFERFAELTAREYRHGARNPLAVRYGRLMNEASRRGFKPNATLAQLDNFRTGELGSTVRSDTLMRATSMLAAVQQTSERVRTALTLICEDVGSSVGHLFLFTSQGLQCSASTGELPDATLGAQVTQWIEDERARAAELDEMDTGQMSDAAAQGAIGRYRVRPLRCVVNGVAILAGVAATAQDAGGEFQAQHEQLLCLLAEQLLQAGLSAGLRLGAEA